MGSVGCFRAILYFKPHHKVNKHLKGQWINYYLLNKEDKEYNFLGTGILTQAKTQLVVERR